MPAGRNHSQIVSAVRAHRPAITISRWIDTHGTALPFDLVVAGIHARLWAQLAEARQLIGPHDLLIAAIAVAYGHAVLTENAREFGRIPGLVVRQPAWPA
jgi:predicted nucleic acid-binding protein